MENEYEPNGHEKQNVSSTFSMYPPNSHYPESAPPPPYSNPSQYPPTSGTPYSQQYPPPTGMPYPQQYPPPNSAVGYPQPYAPPPGGQPYYPQPGFSNQQQQVVIMNTNHPMGVAPVFVVGQPRVSMTGAIVLSCIAYWCFGWLFGGIAFILAMSAQSSAGSGDMRGAIRLRNISYGLSIAGIVIGIIIIAVVAGVLGSRARYSRNYYYCNGYYYYDYCMY